MEPISLYIHIPFCKSKCFYCDFLSFSQQDNLMESYVESLVEEIKRYSDLVKDRKVISIFFGGGTPSTLPPIYISKMMQVIKDQYILSDDAEVTIECNPESLTDEHISAYKDSGINRISMGLQSTNNERLKQLGRIHSYETFLEKYNKLREKGYDNINVDLMFGLPNQTLEDWNDTLVKVLKLEPEHISVYGLLIEADTPFYKANQQKKLVLPEEEMEREMYWNANNMLIEKDYIHYEISNYSKKSYECKHNRVYWILNEYIGMGLGASSYFLGNRLENIKDINNYINAHGDIDKITMSKHTSLIKEQMEEWVFLGLRLINGIDKEQFNNLFYKKFDNVYGEVTTRLIAEGLVVEYNNNLRLTKRGIDVSNYVLSHFILE